MHLFLFVFQGKSHFFQDTKLTDFG